MSWQKYSAKDVLSFKTDSKSGQNMVKNTNAYVVRKYYKFKKNLIQVKKMCRKLIKYAFNCIHKMILFESNKSMFEMDG